MNRVSVALRALLFAAVAAAIGFASFELVDAQASALRQARVTTRVETTRASAATLDNWFKAARAQAEALTTALQPWPNGRASANDARATLDRMLPAASAFDAGAYIVDPTGRVVATSSTGAALMHLDRNSPWVQAALGGGGAVSSMHQDGLTRLDLVAVAAPLKDRAGKVSGVLVASARLLEGSFAQSLASVPVPEGAQIFLVDPGGKTLTPGAKNVTPNANLQRPARLAVTRASGSVEYLGQGKIKTLAAFGRVDKEWSLIATQEARDFFAPTTGQSRAAGMVIAVWLMVLLLVGGILQRRWRKAEGRSERVKRSFLAIAGHELRTPLTAIRGFSQTLTGRWKEISDKKKLELVTTIGRQARNLDNLIERLLVGAQLEAGMVAASSVRAVDIAPAITAAVEHHQALTPLHTFHAEVERPLEAKVDSKGFDRVISQLLENAVKYSPSGGDIHVTGRKKGRQVEVIVEDEGVGLPSDISGIFDKFGQGEDADTRVYDEGGIGLGLFIAKTHLTLMGGTIRAEPREPSGAGDQTGARFIVTLQK